MSDQNPSSSGPEQHGKKIFGKGKKTTKKTTQRGGKHKKHKKVKAEDVTFDPNSDPSTPLPNDLKLFCFHSGDYQECRILERRALGPGRRKEMKNEHVVPEDLRPDVDVSTHEYEYYVHYVKWDRRMDEWVLRDRLCLPAHLKRRPAPSAVAPVAASPMVDGAGHGKGHGGKSKTGGKSKEGEHKDGHGDHEGMTDRELKEHEELTRVKNIDSIVLGKYEIATWYFSPIPAEYNRFTKLFFCEFCLAFFGYEAELQRHSRKCSLRHPPGNEIYRSQEHNVTIAVFEVDGEKEVIYCQNLCYISKLFLDHKTLFFDATPFMFYILCEVDDKGAHVVGYFSKEKTSPTNNLACILTLPCHQRKGYGNYLISLSYELSKMEAKAGGPERPISDLGRLSYGSYWSRVLTNLLKEYKPGDELTVNELVQKTCMLKDDIISTLESLKILTWVEKPSVTQPVTAGGRPKTRLRADMEEEGEWVVSWSALQRVMTERAAKQQSTPRDPNAIWVAPCRPEKLHWTPHNYNKKQKTG